MKNPHPEFIMDDCIGEIKNQRYLDYEQGAKEERERMFDEIDELSNDGEFFLTAREIRQALKESNNG